MSIHAFLVGIDNYAVEDWKIFGPARNALEIAKWLLGKTPPEQIHLFLETSDKSEHREATRRLEAEIAGLPKGIDLHRSCQAQEIEDFWTDTLAKDAEPESTLLVFWSGHGITTNKRHRLFFCSDYKDNRKGRVFHATNFANHLLTDAFNAFPRQLILADVCGVFGDQPVRDELDDDLALGERRQTFYFATPEGQYAKGNDGRGEFTGVVLDVLSKFAEFPAEATFDKAMDARFKRVRQKPFRISGWRRDGQIRESVVGAPAGTGNPWFDSLAPVLRNLDITEETLLRKHRETLVANRIPARSTAQGVLGVLDTLASMQDAQVTGLAPRALLEFLLRLQGEPQCRAPVQAWLDRHAAGQTRTIEEIRERLADRERILIVLVEGDLRGQVVAWQPFLFDADFRADPVWRRERVVVKSWTQFQAGLQAALADFQLHGRLSRLGIQFAVDWRLFNCKFHDIPVAAGGPPIGEEAVVVVRYRARLLDQDPSLLDPWRACAQALRDADLANLRWSRVGEAGALPRQPGLYFATFVLPEKARAQDPRKDILRRLLLLGIPFVYVPHAAPGAGDWDEVGRLLDELVRNGRSLEDIPEAVKQERVRGADLGSAGTLIWDDPGVLPFHKMRSVALA